MSQWFRQGFYTTLGVLVALTIYLIFTTVGLVLGFWLAS